MPSALVTRLFLAVWLMAACESAAKARQLGSYSIQVNRIFVAGISSGRSNGGATGRRLFWDIQGSRHICWRSILLCRIRSVVIGKGLSRLLDGNPARAVGQLGKITRSWADEGLIDPVQNLQHEPIYLWSGRSDLIVQQTVTNELRSFYRDFAANVLRYDNQFHAGHGWESPYGLVPCNRTRGPFINLCYDSSDDDGAYDSEEVWLGEFFGSLQTKSIRPAA